MDEALLDKYDQLLTRLVNKCTHTDELLAKMVELAEYDHKKTYETWFFSYPKDGTRETLSAGTTVLDFDAGTIKAPDGTITDMSSSLRRMHHDHMRSVAINTNKDIVIQLDDKDKIAVRANNWFTETYQSFTRVKIITTTSTDVFVLASTNPKTALEMVGESTSDDTPFADESITIADTAKTLTSATYDDATRAELTLETAQIRFWLSSTPTASVGHLMNIGDTIVLSSPAQIANFKAIRTGSTSGVLRVTYFH